MIGTGMKKDRMDRSGYERIAMALAVLLVGACATNETTKPSLPPITPIMVPPALATVTEPDLGGRVWAWQWTQLIGAERIVADTPESYTIEFQADGRVQLRADCNRGTAGYATAANRSLMMTPAATTRMGCAAGSKGTEFVRQLAEAIRYDFADGDLVLTLKSNAGAMRFMPAVK